MKFKSPLACIQQAGAP